MWKKKHIRSYRHSYSAGIRFPRKSLCNFLQKKTQVWSIQRGLKSQKNEFTLSSKYILRKDTTCKNIVCFFTSHFVTFWASSITNGKRHAKYTFTGLFYCTLSICICKLKKCISLKPVFIVCDCFHQTGGGGIRKPHIYVQDLCLFICCLLTHFLRFELWPRSTSRSYS